MGRLRYLFAVLTFSISAGAQESPAAPSTSINEAVDAVEAVLLLVSERRKILDQPFLDAVHMLNPSAMWMQAGDGLAPSNSDIYIVDGRDSPGLWSHALMLSREQKNNSDKTEIGGDASKRVEIIDWSVPVLVVNPALIKDQERWDISKIFNAIENELLCPSRTLSKLPELAKQMEIDLPQTGDLKKQGLSDIQALSALASGACGIAFVDQNILNWVKQGNGSKFGFNIDLSWQYHTPDLGGFSLEKPVFAIASTARGAQILEKASDFIYQNKREIYPRNIYLIEHIGDEMPL